MTLDEAKEQFRKNLTALQRSSETVRGYMKDLKLFSSYLAERYNCEIYVDEVTTDDVEEYLFYTMEARNYAPTSRKRALISIKSFYRFCEKKGYCKINITKDIEHVKLEQKERTYLTEDEVCSLFEATDDHVIRLIFQTLYYTGLRISECTNLRLQDVDFENNLIYVKQGKGKKDRNIPISDKLRPLLKDYKRLWRVNVGTDNYFSTKSGGICPSYVNRLLKKSTEKAGIKKHVTAHILRHSFASNLLKKGVDILRIQRLLGHSSIKTTSIYTHTNIVDLGQAVNAL